MQLDMIAQTISPTELTRTVAERTGEDRPYAVHRHHMPLEQISPFEFLCATLAGVTRLFVRLLMILKCVLYMIMIEVIQNRSARSLLITSIDRNQQNISTFPLQKDSQNFLCCNPKNIEYKIIPFECF